MGSNYRKGSVAMMASMNHRSSKMSFVSGVGSGIGPGATGSIPVQSSLMMEEDDP